MLFNFFTFLNFLAYVLLNEDEEKLKKNVILLEPKSSDVQSIFKLQVNTTSSNTENILLLYFINSIGRKKQMLTISSSEIFLISD